MFRWPIACVRPKTGWRGSALQAMARACHRHCQGASGSGTQVRRSLRPEAVQITPAGSPAEVTDVTFTGNSVRLTLRMADATMVEADLARSVPVPDKGTTVACTISSGLVTVLAP